MAGLQVPLSTLRLAPRDALRMTRGQSGLLFLHCWRLSLFTLCRSPAAQTCFIFHFVADPVYGLHPPAPRYYQEPEKALGTRASPAVSTAAHWSLLFIFLSTS